MSLRPYQKEAVENTIARLNYSRRGAIVAPTGSGKSHIIAELCRRRKGNGNTLVLSHRGEILEQNYQKIYQVDPTLNLGMYVSRLGKKQIRNVTVASINSIYKKCEALSGIATVIIDECHLFSGKENSMYGKAIKNLEKNNKFDVIGLTATPFRLDSGSIVGEHCFFNETFYDIKIKTLLDGGFICPITSRAPSVQIDTSGVKRVGGDYSSKEISERAGRVSRAALEDAVARLTDRASWLVFAVDVEHCYEIKKTLTDLGVESEVIDGDTPALFRANIYNNFKARNLRCLISRDVLTVGFDAPNIDAIIMLRPTESTALYDQMLGRGMRLFAGKSTCLVLDYAGNILRHGPIDKRDFLPIMKTKGDGTPPFKSCPKCFCCCHTATRVCEVCGYEFPQTLAEEKHNDTHAEGDIFSFQAIPAPVETFEPDSVKYSIHVKKDGSSPPSLRIDYMTELGETISEWLSMFHHSQGARRASIKKWQDRFPSTPVPTSVEAAVTAASGWTHTKVYARRRDKFWDILSTEPRRLAESEIAPQIEEYDLEEFYAML